MTQQIAPLLSRFVELGGSDLYLTFGCRPQARIASEIIPLSDRILTDVDIESYISDMLEDQDHATFLTDLEFNLPLQWSETARFRINLFRQQHHSGIVIRRIQTVIPTPEELGLPPIYNDLIMEQRGLILVVGPTGSGKSTSLAAMLGHRNRHGYGHIVTVEDPIEFVHKHDKCIITQRDIGIDTHSFAAALKNALRQRPDVVLIGEIRDQETMEHALNFSETGHLCVATLHAGNTVQAIERCLNFFAEEKQIQARYSLMQNLKAILSQRLPLDVNGKRSMIVEIMLNRGLIRNLIAENKTREIPDIMARNTGEGMQTFDQALQKAFIAGILSEETILAESDNPANLRLLIQQHHNSRRPKGSEPNITFKNQTGF